MCKAFCFTAKIAQNHRTVRLMFEKNLEMSFLLDFYGDVLSERKRSVMTMYYNEDLSLAEIADEIGISRQGVRELIKKSEDELTTLEQKLGLAQKSVTARQCAERLKALLTDCEIDSPVKSEMLSLAEALEANT